MLKNRGGAGQARSFPAAGPRVVIGESADAQAGSVMLGAETSIGSAADNELILHDTSVSRRHALIRRSPRGYQLVDLQSTNGSFVNGRRVHGAADLKAGDTIRLGAIELIFMEPPEPPLAGQSGRKLRNLLIAVLAIALLSFAGTAGVIWYRSPASAPVAPHTTGDSGVKPWKRLAPVALPSAAPEPRHKTANRLPAPQWLTRLNHFRSMVGEAPVAEDPALSEADRKHVEYLVANYGPVIMAGTLGAFAHREDPGKPGYTPQGAAAAALSDVYYGTGGVTPDDLIDGWISGPFHRLPMLVPGLKTAGFGIYRDADVWAAAVFVSRPDEPARIYGRPIEFPPDGTTVSLQSVRGEWPDPLASCPGYTQPVGLAVTLQLGHLMVPRLTAHSITADGQAIEHCGFDAASYSNPDPMVQQDGRAVLTSYGAVVLIPRKPLTPGVPYRVSITAGGRTYNWSFQVTPPR